MWWAYVCVISSAAAFRGLPVSRRLASSRRLVVKAEDFGLFKGTDLSFSGTWGRDAVISEAKMESYLNENGYRYKLNKTPEERDGQKLFEFPEIQFSIPVLKVDVTIAAPEVASVWEAFGFDSARDVEVPTPAIDDDEEETIEAVAIL
mmetsp:Transcript_3722/g.9583  ORF Transcript_3722/g.9583 Transcript_3722/m.9583 type:complete len:148 (+) Transcript_3722:26-469(+)|eukprot:CAMPEP_0197423994 /NCGR_PEP_ID=MMETSP1170-20131217/24082_1 /TAXON_ID=54406 /ORGANISM="Sarcinochrysis sp, Strain CCMP770" /LENGTH=147 /DNA_ID=CAMNT_0042951455 /DNA_START=26 /DNA_END=469 /DNA_ORIENTATION=+